MIKIYPKTDALLRSMCLRYDSSFGLDKISTDVPGFINFSSGYTKQEREQLMEKMSRVYDLAKSAQNTNLFLLEVKKHENIDKKVAILLLDEIVGKGKYVPEDPTVKSPRAFRQIVLERFLKPEQLSNASIWPRETKILNTLLRKYPIREFWKNVKVPFLLNSLAWFLTQEGSEKLKNMYQVFFLDFSQNPSRVELSSEKIGEDVSIEIPLTLKQKLN